MIRNMFLFNLLEKFHLPFIQHGNAICKDKKAAIVLSGCGVFDGSEIHEAVLTLNAIEEFGASAKFFAPNVEQMHAINHLNGKELYQNRNVLEESARIARGQCEPLDQFNPKDFDILIFIGGFGAAKNLSSFAVNGENCSVNREVKAAIEKTLALKKPIGFLCISPVIAAKCIGNGVKLTIGIDESTAAKINAMGATHVKCDVDSFVVDNKFNVYSTPAYMLAQNTIQLRKGITAMVGAMLCQ